MTTQRVELAEGKNMVSLAVRPSETRMDSIFAPVLGNILAVWGEDEARFAPGVASELADWDWQTSYVVYTTSAVSFDVVGEPIGVETPIQLTAGLNSVPYTLPDPMPVEDAFAELADVLEYVEDGGGRRYPATAGQSALYQLEPGQGYRVRLSADATLSYSVEPKSFDGDINVSTVAEALALTGLQPGQTVGVAGYYRADDGGGGLFEVRDSGAGLDGGLVFVPDEFVSDEIQEVYAFVYGDYRFRGVPPGESVVFGSLRIVLNNAAGTDPFPIDGTLLHGHRHAARLARVPFMDYGAAQFDENGTIYGYFQRRYGDRRNGRIQFTYRRTLSPIRLHRVDVGQTLNAHWFGIRPASEGPMWTGTTDAQPLINHVINLAAERNATGGGIVTDILLPALDTYDYFGSIEIADGLTLRGAAGTELVTVTNDLGHTYQPVRVRDRHTRLRVMGNEAFTHIRMVKDPSDPDYLPPDAKQILNGRPSAIHAETGIMAFGVEDIVLDGNWENNQQAWDEDWASNKELEDWGRNSPGWAGINGSNHGGKRIPQGQTVTVRNVAILGYGSNGLLGNANSVWEVRNLRAGNSLWNHVLYNANGNYTNLTFTGFAWGHAAWGTGTVDNLVYEGGAKAPRRQGNEVFAIRGGDAYDPAELAGNDGYFTREDGTVDPELGTRVEGFYFDLRGSGLKAAFNGLGPNIVIRGRSAEDPGRIVMDDGGLGVFYENGNGWQTALYPGNRFEHIRMYDSGSSERGQTFGRASLTGAVLNDIRTERLQDAETVGATSLWLQAKHRNHEAWDTPQTLDMQALVETTPHFFIANVAVAEDAVGIDVRISDSSFENTTNTLFRGSNGQGTLAGFDRDVSKLRVSFRDTEFNIHDRYFQNLELFFAMSSFQNATDKRSGRTSEDSGQLAITATGGETTVDIPTNLFWKPLEPSYIGVSASSNGLVQSVEAVHSNSKAVDWRAPSLRVTLSRALAAGEQVTFTWSAAVRPIPSN